MLLAVLRRGECPLQVVDDRQKLADETAPRALTCRRGLPGNALPIVLEVGLNPLRELEIVLGLVVDDPLLLVRRILLAGGLARLVTRRDGLFLRREVPLLLGRALLLGHER